MLFHIIPLLWTSAQPSLNGKAFRFFYTFVFFLTLFDGYRYLSSTSTLYVSCEKNIHIAETAQNFWIGTVNWHVSLEAEFKNSTFVKLFK